MRESIENALRFLWQRKFENRDVKISEKDLEELEREGFIRKKNGDYEFTAEGLEIARKLIRLHRLAERLLHDFFETSEVEAERSACKFEHIISDEVEEAICTLLGHPSRCPHGNLIPEGKCCRVKEEEVKRIVYKLSELKPGDEGVIKYLAGDEDVMRKAIALGILPGKKVKVIRTFPAIVIKLGNSNIALDENIASQIYLIKSGNAER
ncbi:iron (metal) dependent repressor, DtxR family [Ferroglobus placidus DSM 10642]|uniref:Iron (Metal) dependent repressor, DtxR family n=1 Tax=Ferroglobus placidus (strain DSM 10642 / AEDII12DO) TaxID=589924 RepID=D3S1K6_FERPA|nr:metal-dependent transcriptional regulator [Ferroglobus placidus]ADC66470.1 iron (metal) dependent repressor, DtxR family [Ferroglobus placidus DSM 10642]